MVEKIKSFLTMTIAAFLISFGTVVFRFPNNFAFGGVTGLAIILNKVTSFSSGQINLILNYLLLGVGAIFLGKKFLAKTLYASTLIGYLIYILEKKINIKQSITGDMMIDLIFSIILSSLGAAILFNIGSSSGGTDIIAMILKKYTSVDVGKGLFLIDIFITVLSFPFFGIRVGLYSVLGLMIKSVMIDSAIESINECKYFHVICDNPDKICDYITEKLQTSATIVEVKGAYLHKKRYMVMTVLKRRQAVKLKRYIRNNESNAFIMITNTSQIIGRGF